MLLRIGLLKELRERGPLRLRMTEAEGCEERGTKAKVKVKGKGDGIGIGNRNREHLIEKRGIIARVHSNSNRVNVRFGICVNLSHDRVATC